MGRRNREERLHDSGSRQVYRWKMEIFLKIAKAGTTQRLNYEVQRLNASGHFI